MSIESGSERREQTKSRAEKAKRLGYEVMIDSGNFFTLVKNDIDIVITQDPSKTKILQIHILAEGKHYYWDPVKEWGLTEPSAKVYPIGEELLANFN